MERVGGLGGGMWVLASRVACVDASVYSIILPRIPPPHFPRFPEPWWRETVRT